MYSVYMTNTTTIPTKFTIGFAVTMQDFDNVETQVLAVFTDNDQAIMYVDVVVDELMDDESDVERQTEDKCRENLGGIAIEFKNETVKIDGNYEVRVELTKVFARK